MDQSTGFELLQRLASGGMGEVFVARKTGTRDFEKRLALKLLLPHLADSPEAVQRFHAEARLAARMNHPNIAYTSTQASSHGAMAFVFGGKGKDGKPFAPGRYEARLMFIGEDEAATKQTETLVFVHDTPEAQSARYAEVQGKLDLLAAR